MIRATSLLSVAVVACAGATLAHAQHSVRIATEVERVENPLLTNVSAGGATVFRISPSYTYDARGERSRSRLSLGAVLERSSNTALLASREYPNLGYTWGYSWPTSDIELRANVAESATRNTEFADVGRVTVDSRERTFLTGARWNTELTERMRLTLDAANSEVSYDSALLQDYRELFTSSRLTWESTETESYYFEPAYARLTVAGTGAVLTQTRWIAGTRREFTPEWSLNAFAGQARLGGSQTGTGTLGGLQLTFTGNRLSSGLEWSKDVVAIGTAARYVSTNSVGLRVGYELAEGARVSARVARSQSSDVAGGRGSLIALTLENELAARWASMLGIEERRSTGFGGLSGRGWAIRAGLIYSYSSGL